MTGFQHDSHVHRLASLVNKGVGEIRFTRGADLIAIGELGADGEVGKPHLT